MSKTPKVTLTPRQVVEELFRRYAGDDRRSAVELYAEDVVVEHPFGKPPLRLEGRQQLLAHLAARGGPDLRIEIRGLDILETGDPEVVVAEADFRVRVAGSDRPLEVPNIFVYRVRDGLVVHSRDYHDHLALAVALGRGSALLAAAES